MQEILELIISFLAIWIYGTEEKPKPPIMRNSVRAVAFSGFLVSAASMLGLLGRIEFPLPLILSWAFCAVLIVTAEYYLGSKKIWVAAIIGLAIWLAIVFTATS